MKKKEKRQNHFCPKMVRHSAASCRRDFAPEKGQKEIKGIRPIGAVLHGYRIGNKHYSKIFIVLGLATGKPTSP
jgi:hypothetical protein